MDGDPAVEPEFDAFSRVFPLPFRVASIVVLGVWAWGANLHYLHMLKIDVPALIRYPPRTSATHPPHHLSTYRLATLLTIPLLGFILVFWLVTGFRSDLVPAWEIIPNLYLLTLIGSFALPMRTMSHSGRYRFLSIMRRVSIGGLAPASDGRFGDILLADVLTSYSKVFGDLFVALCMAFSLKHSTARPDRNCGGGYIVPFLISVPSLIRMRQCLIEFVRVRRGLANKELDIRQSGWGGQHLGNALKYSTAFPVIVLSALQRGRDPADVGMTEAGLFRLWLLAVFINSFYSFYWDVSKDWDLSFFSATLTKLLSHTNIKLNLTPRTHRFLSPTMTAAPSTLTGDTASSYPFGLRRHRFIHAPGIYYTVIALDLLLRCTWSFKLSPHLDHFNDLEGGIFLMECLEVFRRWVWIFLRVETEWVRNNRGPAPDDVLLGEYDHVKFDDD